jgi:phosphatidylserine decarboxylase
MLTGFQTEGIGTVRSDHGHDFEDDGLVSDEETEDEVEHEQFSATEASAAVAPVGTISVTPAISESEDTTPTQTVPPIIVAPVPEPASRSGILPRLFSASRRPASTPSLSTDDSATPSPRPASRGDTSTPSNSKRPKFGRSRTGKESAYNFGGEKDVLGIVLLEVNRAEDLPKLKNSGFPTTELCNQSNSLQ